MALKILPLVSRTRSQSGRIVSCRHTLAGRLLVFLVEAIGETLWPRACLVIARVNCRLLQPVVATPKDARATITIPAGALVEVRPTLHKGLITEVLWEGECFSVELDDVLSSCSIDDVGKFGWYRN